MVTVTPPFGDGSRQPTASATEALARADNARDMVLRRDPRLLSVEEQQKALEALAAQLGKAIPAADATRAEQWAAIHALEAAVAAIKPTDLTALTARVTAAENETSALKARVAALEKLQVIVGFGQATLSGSLLAGATQNVVVTLSRDMGNATYAPGYSLNGGAGLLGSLTIDGIVTQTSKTVTLRIRNTSLLGLTLTNAVVGVVAAREV